LRSIQEEISLDASNHTQHVMIKLLLTHNADFPILFHQKAMPYHSLKEKLPQE